MTHKNKLRLLLIPLIVLSASCVHHVPANYHFDRDYHLPFTKGASSLLIQGPNGVFSHRGPDFEFDFLMPVNTPILAARGGVVLTVQDNFVDRCPLTKNCSANFVAIRHDDGSIARYLHINQYSACVSEKQKIQRGDVIALSGNVGISLLPHLHFDVLWRSIIGSKPPLFVEVDQKGSGMPKAGRRYVSANSVKVNHCEDLLIEEFN